jgi:hypothetical protein
MLSYDVMQVDRTAGRAGDPKRERRVGGVVAA